MTGHPFPDCPHVFTEGDGIPMFLDGRYWCQAWIDLGISGRRRRCPEDCPPVFGEFGAWRSALGFVYNAARTATVVETCDGGHATYITVNAFCDAVYALSAVGGSP